jgi:predicted DNA-binding protein (MmcQ/YjbR family)
VTLDELRALALAFPGAAEEYPFGGDTAVFKAANRKMFVLASVDPSQPLRVTVKLTPEEASEALLFPFVSVAAYLGRHGWVTARVSAGAEWEIARPWVERSHALVTAKPARRAR